MIIHRKHINGPKKIKYLLLQGFGRELMRSVLNRARELLRVKSMKITNEPAKEILKSIGYPPI